MEMVLVLAVRRAGAEHRGEAAAGAIGDVAPETAARRRAAPAGQDAGLAPIREHESLDVDGIGEGMLGQFADHARCCGGGRNSCRRTSSRRWASRRRRAPPAARRASASASVVGTIEQDNSEAAVERHSGGQAWRRQVPLVPATRRDCRAASGSRRRSPRLAPGRLPIAPPGRPKPAAKARPPGVLIAANAEGGPASSAETAKGRSTPQAPGPSTARVRRMPAVSWTSPEARHAASTSARHGSRVSTSNRDPQAARLATRSRRASNTQRDATCAESATEFRKEALTRLQRQDPESDQATRSPLRQTARTTGPPDAMRTRTRSARRPGSSTPRSARPAACAGARVTLSIASGSVIEGTSQGARRRRGSSCRARSRRRGYREDRARPDPRRRHCPNASRRGPGSALPSGWRRHDRGNCPRPRRVTGNSARRAPSALRRRPPAGVESSWLAERDGVLARDRGESGSRCGAP